MIAKCQNHIDVFGIMLESKKKKKEKRRSKRKKKKNEKLPLLFFKRGVGV